MAAMLTLWSHALAALLFGVMGLASVRGTERGWPRLAFVTATLLTALWALAVAGIDASDVSVRLVGAGRNLTWLWFVAVLAGREGVRGRAVTALTLVTAVVLGAAMVLDLALASPLEHRSSMAIEAVQQALSVLATLGALILLCQLAQTVRRDGGWVALALGAMWSADLIVSVAGPDTLSAVAAIRGLILIVVGAMLGAAAQRSGAQGPSVSRPAAVRLLGLLAVGGYLAAIAWAADAASVLDPRYARIVQTAIVLGGTVALATLVSTPWLHAWLRVKLAKHLFPHRYDYRVEWQRFTSTLGRPGGGEPLGRRLVRAVADLTYSPAGLLLSVDDRRLSAAASWNWNGESAPVTSDRFVATLESGHIVSLDDDRLEHQSDAPAWLLADGEAWIVVPLVHGETLTGAIVLARPPASRALDWEDLDLLRVAGRQAASYLAEDRAHAALAEAARFDEFNRRFAFVLHDIKNVASQLSLVARNAERHAENPAFRADMIETLRDGAGRLGTLLARLGGQESSREPIQPVDVASLAYRLAALGRGSHPIEVETVAAFALAAPARLEQALAHLLQNAREASGEQPVRLIVSGREGVTIEVVDRGAGMAADFVREELFRPFSSTKPGGFGIGAYEARQLVHAMGGVLDVESQEGVGTSFRILLPAAPALEVAA